MTHVPISCAIFEYETVLAFIRFVGFDDNVVHVKLPDSNTVAISGETLEVVTEGSDSKVRVTLGDDAIYVMSTPSVE